MSVLITRYSDGCEYRQIPDASLAYSATEEPTKTLLITKSVVEAVTGIALIIFSAIPVFLLLGLRMSEPAGNALARIAGVALLTLGISCWLAREDGPSRAARGLVVALLFYDVGVVLILLCAHFRTGLLSVGLWPAVAVHSGLGVWSSLCLTCKAKSSTL